MPLVEIHNAHKSFGSLVVTDDLSMHLDEGEALGVIGPNGAGKTTLFNLISGGLAPDRGRVTFDGADITGVPAHERCCRGIGRSHQIPHPFVGMTVFENLLVGATFGAGKSERTCYASCAEVLEKTGLIAKANVPAGRLSLLERKRLELARALASDPSVLLLDEMAGGLTEQECLELVNTIGNIRAEGISIIWIEHVVHALLSVVDRLIVINFGKKIDDGDPHTVMNSRQVQKIYMGISAE